ncbi:MAG: XTP/dITP diphosphatase [Nitrospira sp.]|nr:XTP/dITP diphosphatase [Nitrospira sp.]MDH4327162.1 XTP/dITP diphosphatase [Nitrospira sp.]MDH5252469.1 XTP/dITP diphosphatase [Nitrospira sp.]MDH5625832.1 XTP/dITP diphosphatase [Nitrospira sp.]
MLKEIVLATRNRHKGEELMALLGDLGITIRTLADFPDAPDVDEDGATCAANAVKKAREIAHATGMVAVADDTGLEVEALGGRPGVYAARYAGEQATYEDNCRKLLQELAGVPTQKRTAKFLTVAAIADPTGQVQVTQGILEGRITDEPIGDRGFGYDPVFFLPELGKTLAELTPEEKNGLSHRAKAFANMRVILKTLSAA